jgi:transposase InsO family protein
LSPDVDPARRSLSSSCSKRWTWRFGGAARCKRPERSTTQIKAQYTSFAFPHRLAAEGLVGSMGTVGDALDNAMCESLIGTMKIEKLNRRSWRSVEDVRAAVFKWIETWYNGRRHSSLGYLSPLDYEHRHQQEAIAG